MLFLVTFKTKPKIYPFAIKRILLPLEGEIFYAQWLHPKEAQKQIRQEDVDELRTFLAPGDVAIDIGAHTDDSTLPIVTDTRLQSHPL